MKQTRIHLKSRFEHGDRPTTEDFEDLFDSFIHKDELYINDYAYIENTNISQNTLLHLKSDYTNNNAGFYFKKYDFSGNSDKRVGMYWEHETHRNVRMWMGDDGYLYSKESSDPTSSNDGRKFIQEGHTSNKFVGIGQDNPYSKLHIGEGNLIVTIPTKPGGYTDRKSLVTVLGKGDNITSGIMIGVEDTQNHLQRMELFVYDGNANEGAYGIATSYYSGATQPFYIYNGTSTAAFKIDRNGEDIYFPHYGIGNCEHTGEYLLSASNVGKLGEEKAIKLSNSISKTRLEFQYNNIYTSEHGYGHRFFGYDDSLLFQITSFNDNFITAFKPVYLSKGVKINWSGANSDSRPSYSTGDNFDGFEFRATGISNAADHGFLRLRAGGGTSTSQLSYIDISGYSTNADMDKNIVFGTAGSERMRIKSNGNIKISNNLEIDNAIALSPISQTSALDKSIFRNSNNSDKLSYRDGNHIYEINMTPTGTLS